MVRSGFRRYLPVVALVTSLLLAAGFAQPRVQVAALTVNAGTLQGFITSHSVIRSAPRAPGAYQQSGSGLCFGPASAQRSTTFACFHRVLTDSGLDMIFDDSRTYTVFAPTDAAFAHLAQTIGSGCFRDWLSRRDALVTLVRQLVVPGSHPLGSLAFGAPAAGRALTLTTLSGRALQLEIGPGSSSLSATRSVSVGPASAVDGQAYVSDVSTRFRDGSILVPISRVPLWGGMPGRCS